MVRPSLIAAILMLAAGSASAQISIADYGAVPNDGVDDWTAVQAALASIPAVGGSVYVPPGTYDLSDTIQLKSRTRLFGVGPASILKFHGVSGGAGTSGAAGIMASANNNSDMTIHNLGIDTSEVTSNNRCIAFYLSANTRIEKVRCRTSGHAFVHVRSSNYWVVNNHIEVTNTLGHGVIDQWWGSHGGHIVGNTLDGNGLGLYGILVTGTDTSASQSTPCYDVAISGNIVRNMDHAGIYLQGHLGGLDNVVV